MGTFKVKGCNMRDVVQRVKQATVSIDGTVSVQIAAGLLVLAGTEEADWSRDRDRMGQKLVN